MNIFDKRVFYKLKIFTIFFFIIFVITSCKNGNLTYHVSVASYKPKDAVVNGSSVLVKASSIKKVKIYLETSASMRGYINKHDVNDSGYIIKKIVPYLITDLYSKIASPELFTISSQPTKYKKSKEEFVKSLFDGTLFQGGSTYIHRILEQILNNFNQNDNETVSILISDCILDIGDNKGQRDQVGSAIYDLLNRKQVAAMLFQYYSEFNGDWYYNQNSSDRPFHGLNITMHKRPFYIWVFGNPQNLSYLLKSKIFKNYHNSFTYGINISNKPHLKLINNTGGRKVYISENDDFTLIDYTQGDTGSFVIGMNLSKFPDYIQRDTYLRNNLRLDNTYFKKKIQFAVYRENDFVKKKMGQFDKPDKVNSVLSSFTHVLDISISNLMPVVDTSFNISLVVQEPSWIKQASISADLGKKAKELEGKTYSFNIITDAFKDKFLIRNNCIFKINFKKIK